MCSRDWGPGTQAMPLGVALTPVASPALGLIRKAESGMWSCFKKGKAQHQSGFTFRISLRGSCELKMSEVGPRKAPERF